MTGGWINAIICGLAVYKLYGKVGYAIMVIAIMVCAINVISYLIADNFRKGIGIVPNSLVFTNMITVFIGVGLLIFSFFA
jgi:hypothetical protein